MVGEVKRFDTEAIPGGEEFLGLEIVDGEREHSSQEGKRVFLPEDPGLKQEFGIAGCFLGEPCAVDFGTQFVVVVEFAVVDEDITTVWRAPGLGGRIEVADGESSMGKGDGAIDEQTGVVGAAIGHGIAESGQLGGCDLGRVAMRCDESDKTAHEMAWVDEKNKKDPAGEV